MSYLSLHDLPIQPTALNQLIYSDSGQAQLLREMNIQQLMDYVTYGWNVLSHPKQPEIDLPTLIMGLRPLELLTLSTQVECYLRVSTVGSPWTDNLEEFMLKRFLLEAEEMTIRQLMDYIATNWQAAGGDLTHWGNFEAQFLLTRRPLELLILATQIEGYLNRSEASSATETTRSSADESAAESS